MRAATPPAPRAAPSRLPDGVAGSPPASPRPSPFSAFRRPAAAGRTTTPRPRPVLGESQTASRARAGTSHGRVTEEQRTRLGDLTAGLAAGAASASVLALLLLPGLPASVALAVGALVSGCGGALVLAPWSRSAVRDGTSPTAARRQAVRAVVAAHAVAAVPIGLAVLLAS